jgi:hypothetical protein
MTDAPRGVSIWEGFRGGDTGGYVGGLTGDGIGGP